MGEAAEQREDVRTAEQPQIITVVIAMQPQAGRQFSGPVHVLLQGRGGVVAPAGGQFLGHPPLDGLAEPGLGDPGEVDDAAAAVTEYGGVPHVLALLFLRRRLRLPDRLLQILHQRPVISLKLGDVEAGDCRAAAGQEPPAEDPELVQVGHSPESAAFLETEQDLRLDQRGQAPQDDLVAAGHRCAGPAPGTEIGVGDLSGAFLLPPAVIMRAAQASPPVRLAGADRDLARAEARQRPGLRMGEECR